jgi:uncharacterized protein DUF3592
MLNFIFDGMAAYNQAGLFVGGLFCLAAGCFLLGYAYYQRTRAFRATGTIIGVLYKDDMFCPVYRYTAPDGQSHVAKSDSKASWSRGKETGRVVPLLISRRNPAQAREAKGYVPEIAGIGVLAFGLWLAYTALTSYPITWLTWLVTFAFVAVFLADRAYRILGKGRSVPLDQWKQRLKDEWDQQLRAKEETSIDLADVKPIEQILADPERQRTDARQLKIAAPFLAVFAVFLVGFGIQESKHIARLDAAGLRAEGEVVRLKREYSSDDSGRTVYFAIVRFRTDKNERVEFKDRMGSNPPSYRRGDKVSVLYLADNPREAVIDRGFWGNWAVPGLLFAAAAFVMWLLVMMLRNAVRQRAARRRASDATAPASAAGIAPTTG